jgi:hypothetical protein
MRKPIDLRCSCGTVIGQEVFSHVDPKMRGFGTPDGAVYKNVYNGKEARTKDGMIIPLKDNQYLCKNCYNRGKNNGSSSIV